jgi:hypothetical protein
MAIDKPQPGARTSPIQWGLDARGLMRRSVASSVAQSCVFFCPFPLLPTESLFNGTHQSKNQTSGPLAFHPTQHDFP